MKEFAFVFGCWLLLDAIVFNCRKTLNAAIAIYYYYLKVRGRKVFKGTKDGVNYIIVTDKDGNIL